MYVCMYMQALEKMEVVEEPQEEAKFRFSLPSPEPLGRPIIQINNVCMHACKHASMYVAI